MDNLNTNLINLIASFKKTGQSDEVIKQSLWQLGMIPEVVESHLDYYNKNAAKIDKDTKPKNNKSKGNNKKSYSQKEIDRFLTKIQSNDIQHNHQEQELQRKEEVIEFKPVYIENQFKNQEKKGEKK